MLKILKHLKKYWVSVLIIIALLVLQAVGDLALPEYTSNIVNVGITQGGIEHATPVAIREDTLNTLYLFMPDEDVNTVKENYALISKDSLEEGEYNSLTMTYPAAAESSVYYLVNDDTQTVLKLDAIFEMPLVIHYFLENSSSAEAGSTMESTMDSSSVEGIDMEALSGYMESTGMSLTQVIGLAVENGTIEKADLLKFRDSLNERLETTADSLIGQSAIAAVKAEYTALDMDLGSIQTSYLIRTGIKMLLIAFLIMAVAILVGLFAARTAASVGRDLRSQVFSNVVSFSNAELNEFSTASLITRSTNDIQQVQMVSFMMLRMIFYAPILGIGGVLKVLGSNTYMAWIIALGVGVIFLVVIVLVSVAMPKFKKMQILLDKLNLVSREILTGLPVIRAFSREHYEEKRFETANADLTGVSLFTSRIMSLMMPLMMLIMNVITVLILWVGANGVDVGAVLTGDIIAFITYTMQIIMSFLMLTMVSIMMPRAIVSAGRIDEVINTKSSIVDPENPVQPEDIAKAAPKVSEKRNAFDNEKGTVVFHDVSFRYPGAEENMLSHISFTAQPGKTTAIIGSTGSGKSTLIQLIPRLYDVTEGEITVDGVDVRKMSQKDLRARIGFVPQKGVLFSGTIESNLKFGAPEASLADIENAARIAQAADFIAEKEDGYEAQIAQGGTNVSGGQKQRLAIARALAKNPDIYIFDDSFSALDYKTDAALRQALKDEVTDSTIIIVAQRISTVLYAEQIIVLDEGQMVGIGSHEELMKNCETYQQIARSQLSEEELANTEKGGTNNE